MSYNHNPFLVLSDSVISSGIIDVATRVKAAENKLKDTIYLMSDTNTFVFDDVISLLPLFAIHINGSILLNNGIYNGNAAKIHLKVNINYMWVAAEYPPRFSLLIMKNNNETLFSIYEGVNDSTERMNKLYEDVLIDVNNNDKINIILQKDQIETHDTITIIKNSYISFGVV